MRPGGRRAADAHHAQAEHAVGGRRVAGDALRGRGALGLRSPEAATGSRPRRRRAARATRSRSVGGPLAGCRPREREGDGACPAPRANVQLSPLGQSSIDVARRRRPTRPAQWQLGVVAGGVEPEDPRRRRAVDRSGRRAGAVEGPLDEAVGVHDDVGAPRDQGIGRRQEVGLGVVVDEQVARRRRVVEDRLRNELAVVGAVAVGVGAGQPAGGVERAGSRAAPAGGSSPRPRRRARFWPKPRSRTAIVRPAAAVGDAAEDVGAAALEPLADDGRRVGERRGRGARPGDPGNAARARRPRRGSATTWSWRPRRRCTCEAAALEARHGGGRPAPRVPRRSIGTGARGRGRRRARIHRGPRGRRAAARAARTQRRLIGRPGPRGCARPRCPPCPRR